VADLKKSDWTRAAFITWGKGGLAAVAVEPLAAALKVTKGSFYWHFKNRADLVRQVIEMWETEGTLNLIAQLQQIEDPRQRLASLFSAAFREPDLLRGEAAIAAAALTGDKLVAPAYARVTDRRLDFVTQAFSELGLTRGEARRRAVATYSAYLGSTQLALAGVSELATETQLRKLAKTFVELLVPSS
jgi:AcrR family transcriptional regulator